MKRLVVLLLCNEKKKKVFFSIIKSNKNLIFPSDPYLEHIEVYVLQPLSYMTTYFLL